MKRFMAFLPLILVLLFTPVYGAEIRSGAVGGGGTGASVSDTAYGVSWDGDSSNAPSKNAVYDKIETLGAGAGDVTGVGDCASGACYDGSADGGTYIRLYDGTGAYISETAGVRTLTLVPSNANAESLVITFGDNNNIVSLSSGTGGVVNISGSAATTTGNAATATALAADPANCSAGQIALGITAAGVAECTATPSGLTSVGATTFTGALTGTASGNAPASNIALSALANQAAQTVNMNATDSAAAPTAVAISASQVVARLAAGNVKGASAAEMKTLLGYYTSGDAMTGSISGNAGTATALAADPANCASGQVAVGITAAGVAECVSALTGSFTFGQAAGAGYLSFLEDPNNGTSKTKIIGSASLAGDVTFTTPATSGTAALTADKLSAFAATTSAELAGVISDETGAASGSPLLVFNQSPTLVTPNIGVATGTSLAVTGILDGKATLAACGATCSPTALTSYVECTENCTITPPAPAAGVQICARNSNNGSYTITFAALGATKYYELPAHTGLGTGTTGTLAASAAVTNSICLVGYDASHYYIWGTPVGTWTAN